MNHYAYANPNPKEKKVGDCTVRAISLALNKPWGDIYLDLSLKGYLMADMPSSNDVWGSYLIDNGWKYQRLQDNCPFCYTINDFCEEHKTGNYIVATGSHIVYIKDGIYYDAWDSGDKIPLFYFIKE